MIGLTIAQYRIDAELGRGGMGVVYRAFDTKLDRTVALKVLPAAALASEDDRARFYREAKAAAQLHHPNIASVFQIDEAVPHREGHAPQEGAEARPFIAMEYIEGDTLEARIRKAPLKLNEAVSIAAQVAEALKAAHAKEIVHRDIKSANVMLTSDGVAKVLDFGLAKTQASTMLTRQGSTLGTVAYMSPEQARGQEVDGRTDLYSLGTVLYEMVAGRLPFAGDYEQAVVYGILNEPPEPLTALRTGVPMELERITLKLLAKEAARRYQTAVDLIADLGGVAVSSVTSVVRPSSDNSIQAQVAPSVESRRPTWHLAVAGLALLLSGALGTWLLTPPAPQPPVERLMLDMEGMRAITSVGISPDSRYIAMTGYDWDGREGLFLYSVENGSITHVERSERAFYPWFSPSGDRVSFEKAGETAMYVMDVPTGTPRLLVADAWTAYWMDDDRVLYTENAGSEEGPNFIYSLSGDSSTVVRGTERASDGPAWFFPGPRIPGSNLAVGNQQGRASFGLDPQLYVVDADQGVMTETEYSGINVQPLSGDILIYQLGDDAGKLVARRFDTGTRRFTSQAVDLLDPAFFARFQAEPISGSLVFAPDNLPNRQLVTVLDLAERKLTSFDIAGGESQVIHIALGADGGTLVGTSIDGETGLTRITTVDLRTNQMVVRSEDMTEFGVDLIPGDRMLSLYYELENGREQETMQLVARSLRTGARADTLSAPFPRLTYAGIIDEGMVVTVDDELGLLDPEGSTFTPWVPSRPFPDLSYDGRFIAYQTPSGLLAVFDRASGFVTELTGIRGANPQWSDDGRYLYFFSLDGIPESTDLEEAEVSRLQVRLAQGFEVAGDPEFVLHVRSPVQLSVGRGRLAVHSNDGVSLDRPARHSVRVAWWRNVGQEVDRALPR